MYKTSRLSKTDLQALLLVRPHLVAEHRVEDDVDEIKPSERPRFASATELSNEAEMTGNRLLVVLVLMRLRRPLHHDGIRRGWVEARLRLAIEVADRSRGLRWSWIRWGRKLSGRDDVKVLVDRLR